MTSSDLRWDRGSCPRCGSDQVLHRVIGMPLADAVDSAPSWVSWEGCTGFAPERECLSCTHSWWESDHGFAQAEDEEWYDAHDEEMVPAPPPPLRVVGAVIVEGDRFLTARRGPGKSAAGLWEFPGGKIEPGEAPQQALARELREELSVDIEVGWLIGRGESRSPARTIHLDCYWARLRGGPPAASTDHDLLEWVGREQLERRDWALPDVPIVRALLDGAEPTFTGS